VIACIEPFVNWLVGLDYHKSACVVVRGGVFYLGGWHEKSNFRSFGGDTIFAILDRTG
jgi:hypothetical protein